MTKKRLESSAHYGFTQRKIPADEIFCEKWTSGSSIAIILHGHMVAISDLKIFGGTQEEIITTYGPKDIVGLEAVFGSSYDMTIKASTDVEILEINILALFKLMESNNKIMRKYFLKVISMYFNLLRKYSAQKLEIRFLSELVENLRSKNIELAKNQGSVSISARVLRAIVLKPTNPGNKKKAG